MKNKKTVDMQTTVVRNQEIIFSGLDGGTVMMSLAKGEYYGIDPVGRRIWELMENPVKVSAMCATLCGEYKVDPEQCQKDVLAFLVQLADKEILDIVDG